MACRFHAITATIDVLALEKVEKALQRAGVPGLSVNYVKGYGVYRNFYQRDWLDTHARIQIYAREEEIDRLVETIMEAVHTGSEDDGIIVVHPVSRFYRICDRRDLCREEA